MINPKHKPSIFQNNSMAHEENEKFARWIKITMPYSNTPGNQAELIFTGWDVPRANIKLWKGAAEYTLEELAATSELLQIALFIAEHGSVAAATAHMMSVAELSELSDNLLFQSLNEARIHPDPKLEA